MAWGKPWPHQFRRTISKSEIINEATGPVNENDLDFTEGPLRDILHIPASYEYICFTEMLSVIKAFTAGPIIGNVLVVRKEYTKLREVLEKDSRAAIVITGQPGIGSYETLVHV